MQRRAIFILAVLTCLSGAVAISPLVGQQATASKATKYEIDNVHSSFVFRAGHAGVGYVFGRFNTISGEFTLTEGKPAESRFDVAIEVKSIETNHPDRNKHLLTADFFDAEKFPTMTFKTKSIAPAKGGLEVTGDFSLHGVTKEITLELEKIGEGKDPFGVDRAGFYAELTIKRSDYGMDKLLNAVGDEVRLYLAFEGKRST